MQGARGLLLVQGQSPCEYELRLMRRLLVYGGQLTSLGGEALVEVCQRAAWNEHVANNKTNPQGL